MLRRVVLVWAALCAAPAAAADPTFRAGAAAVDVTPERFPVVVNCGFAEASAGAARDRLHARAIVLDDGPTRLAVVVVDNCMMPREFLDRVKGLVAAETKIPADRQLISATHTHSAPAVMGCLGSDPDPAYGAFLERQIVQTVREAVANLAPAEAGWAVADAGPLTHNRQWVLRSDKARADPFGDLTVRSNMHPGYQHPDFVGPSGPTDPWLTVLAVRHADGRPLAVLANFSMHYFGSAPVSADYFGLVCAKLERRVGGGRKGFVAALSQGTAGDLQWMDYGKPQPQQTIDAYADAVADVAAAAVKGVRYRADTTLAMAETTLTLNRRVPSPERLAWAKKVVAELGDRKPITQPEIYAREAVLLHTEPKRELKFQAIRVGDLGIAAIPNEVFALTGLKIKAQSPLAGTFVVELANGSEGYIPPPEQHPLGGYTTWPARSAALEAGAEAKVTDTVLGLLERVAGKMRKPLPDPSADPYARAVLAAEPVGYWRLGELVGATAADLAGKNPGRYETGVVFGLEGPVPRRFDGQAAVNRAAHFAGGRVTAPLPPLGDRYSVELWFWNGFPADVRDWTGTFFTLTSGGMPVDALAFGGKKGTAGALAVPAGEVPSGRTAVPFRTWFHAAFVRDGNRVRAYLNGKEELAADLPAGAKPDGIVIGGRPDGVFGFEGRLAEVAVYDRPLTAGEVAARVRAADDPKPVRVLLKTDKGDIEIEVDAAKAPKTAANFLRYVDAKLYDGGRFHRTVTPDNQPDNKVKIEVIQAGVNPDKAKDEFPPIELERTKDTGLSHKDGTISMARDGPDTATGDFFVCVGDQPELDFGGKRNPDGQGFAAFGRVVKGMDVVKKIQAAPAEGQALKPAVAITAARRLP